MPVAEYEPPTRNVQNVPQCRQSSHATLRRRTPRAPGQRGNPHPQAAPAREVMSPSMRQAAVFADAALRRVLEVIDRRRPATQLRPLLAPSLVDSVLSAGRSLAGSSAGSEAAAVLRRMRLQPVGRHNPDTAAEVFGTYSRGDRIHAIACRVERVPTENTANTAAGTRWLVVALHIG
ncbi:Rv3235 family protein [Mycobacterium sp.]|uniref:Rv3235 family protein n=1 Tax=Mycobacterium sp. TaxID=1785 RepID=UPI003F99454A